jgi:hypothetical protein
MKFSFEGLFGGKDEDSKLVKPDPFKPRLQTPPDADRTLGEPTYIVEPGTRSAANQVETLVRERNAIQERRGGFTLAEVGRLKEIDAKIAELSRVRHNQELEE